MTNKIDMRAISVFFIVIIFLIFAYLPQIRILLVPLIIILPLSYFINKKHLLILSYALIALFPWFRIGKLLGLYQGFSFPPYFNSLIFMAGIEQVFILLFFFIVIICLSIMIWNKKILELNILWVSVFVLVLISLSFSFILEGRSLFNHLIIMVIFILHISLTLIIISSVKKRKDFVKYIWIWLISIILYSVFVNILYLSSITPFLIINSNYLAVKLVTVLPIGFYLLKFSKLQVKEKTFLSLGIFSVFISLILSKSEASYLALIAAALYFFYLVLSQKRNVFKFIFTVSIALLFIASFLLFPQLNQGKDYIYSELKETLENPLDPNIGTGRVGLWKASLLLVADNPLGIGLLNFHSYYINTYIYKVKWDRRHIDYILEKDRDKLNIQDEHNTFLNILTNLGFLGLLLYLTIVLYLLRNLYRYFKRDKDYGLFGVFIVFLVCSLFLNVFFKLPIIWMLISFVEINNSLI